MSVTIKRSRQGAVVIARGWGFVTASALMPYREARQLAVDLVGRHGKIRVRQ